MSMSGLTNWSFQMPPFPVRRWTVDEYHHMIETGIITENDPVELLEGWIVPKMGRNPPHDVAIELTMDALRSRLPEGWRIRVQSAVTTDDSEPEPDLAVVRGNPRDHLKRHPGPQDVAVMVEVADSSLAHDRRDKGRAYAKAGLAVYWIVNLVDCQVEVYTEPSGPALTPSYRRRQDYSINDAVPLMIDGQTLGPMPVRDLLP
jgi:Uma2 family endonuclease